MQMHNHFIYKLNILTKHINDAVTALKRDTFNGIIILLLLGITLKYLKHSCTCL